MGARYSHKFVACTMEGKIYDVALSEEAEQPTLYDLGQAGWHVVGVIPEACYPGFGHTLILEQRAEAYYDRSIDDIVESDPT